MRTIKNIGEIKMKKIGIAVFALMFAGTAYVGAQEIEIDFDGKSDIQKSQSIQTMDKSIIFKTASELEYNIPVPEREIKHEVDDNGFDERTSLKDMGLNEASIFYSEEGYIVENLHIVKMLEVKNKRDENTQSRKWVIDFEGNIYSMNFQANAMDFKKIKDYLSVEIRIWEIDRGEESLGTTNKGFVKDVLKPIADVLCPNPKTPVVAVIAVRG